MAIRRCGLNQILKRLYCSCLHPQYNLVNDIRDLMVLCRECQLTHALREFNQVVDGLAKCGLEHKEGDIIFECLPSFVSTAFNADCMGVCFP